nr:U-box domain-containing protein 35-like [Ipomoea batatas]
MEGLNALPHSPSLVVAVAINGKSKSKYVVNWALDKFVPEGKILFKLLHVRPVISAVPTPMGNSIPISQVRDDVAAAFVKEIEWQTSQKLLPYKALCTRRKVEVEVQQIESDNIVNAIANEVVNCNIDKVVIGASSRRMFSRRQTLSARISEGVPSFCTVYAISKGKLSSIRPSSSDRTGSVATVEDSETSCSTSISSGHGSRSLTERSDSTASYSQFCSSSLPLQRFQALSNINQTLLHKRTGSVETVASVTSTEFYVEPEKRKNNESSKDIIQETKHVSTSSIVTDDSSWTNDQASTSDVPREFSPGEQVNINFELEKLRIELRHIRGMYAMAQTEAVDASRKISDLRKQQLEEEIRLKGILSKEEEARAMAEKEREKYEAARTEADYVKNCAEREASVRKEAEMNAIREAKEKEKLENAFMGRVHHYQEFTWEEIESATSSFSEDLKIGMGAYGTVYKCNLHHTTVAVKVLRSMEAQRTKQFQQELEVLSRIRHPHLLILLGACSDHGCLVYEFMENGSLDDRLFRKNNTPPIPWFDRYRIAWEVASALVFLHNSKPETIVHRDLKPGNILLDRNLVSKIGDVGLSTVIHSGSSMSTLHKDTGPVGTVCYIDPEYTRTGLISPKSDVYALGMVILQLLTAKQAIGLTHIVETAIDIDTLAEILDTEAGKWPLEETKELTKLALKCTELKRKDRPDLKDHILPILEKLKDVANQAKDLASIAPPPPPNYFMCPILKDIMEDPCVAADGYTYDRKAIEIWLNENENSPMTKLPLPHKNLLPNYTILSAITVWKSGKQ